jgi:SMI1-KNR4 cell-wall
MPSRAHKGQSMRDLSDLQVSKGRRPVPTREEVRELERQIGAVLPEDYVEFLLQINGGHPLLDTFTSREGRTGDLNNFFFLGEPDSTESLNWNLQNRPASLGSAVPFARDGGGNLFALDLMNGAVLFWNHDTDGTRISRLADSFSELIDGLQENPDYI